MGWFWEVFSGALLGAFFGEVVSGMVRSWQDRQLMRRYSVDLVAWMERCLTMGRELLADQKDLLVSGTVVRFEAGVAERALQLFLDTHTRNGAQVFAIQQFLDDLAVINRSLDHAFQLLLSGLHYDRADVLQQLRVNLLRAFGAESSMRGSFWPAKAAALDEVVLVHPQS